jgi:hypothetical protein
VPVLVKVWIVLPLYDVSVPPLAFIDGCGVDPPPSTKVFLKYSKRCPSAFVVFG